jgi:hypothetical protein
LLFILPQSRKDIHETFINGANVYLKKPNNFELLKKLLSRAIDTSCISKEASLDRKTFFSLFIEMNDLVVPNHK